MSALKEAIENVSAVRPYGDGWLVDTTCLFPSGKVIQVSVKGTATRAMVDDAGATLDELATFGIAPRDGTIALKPFARKFGLNTERGMIYEADVPADAIPSSIRLVAMAAHEAARNLFHSMRLRPSRQLRETVGFHIKQKYSDVFSTKTVDGRNKSYQFDFAAERGNRLMVIEPVLPDPTSINAKIASYLDLRAALGNHFSPVLIYDDEDNWSAESLGLLQLTADVVKLPLMEEKLGRMLH